MEHDRTNYEHKEGAGKVVKAAYIGTVYRNICEKQSANKFPKCYSQKQTDGYY